jgi:putative DNA primase/helicase
MNALMTSADAVKKPWQAATVEEAVAMLADMDPLTYEQHRETVAGAFDIKRLSALDKAVERKRKKANSDNDPFGWEVKPSPVPIEGSSLLTEIEKLILRHVVMPKHSAAAVTLWIAHAWTHEYADISPILTLSSPEPRCGKTTLLNTVQALVPRPLVAANITAASLFRAVETWRPTLLIDEADSFMGNSDELRGIINSGHTKASAYVVRTVEADGDHQPKRFYTWAPKVIAAIGKLSSTVMDRSVVITMKRKLAADKVERLRDPMKDYDFETMRQSFRRWADDNSIKLTGAEPEVPDCLHDRAADNWRTLMAIAELVGGHWPQKAREAAIALAGDTLSESETNRTMLLQDIKALFMEKNVERLSSLAMVNYLVSLEHRPWPEWKRGRPITQNQLARVLAPFGVAPTELRIDGRKERGYSLAQFLDTFEHYIPDKSGTTVQTASNHDFLSVLHPVQARGCTVSKNAKKPHEHSICTAVPDGNAPIDQEGLDIPAWLDRRPRNGVLHHNEVDDEDEPGFEVDQDGNAIWEANP